jgi:hypothetical protein
LSLLADDNEWHQCLEEAGLMATGHQLRALFVAILIDGNPANPKHCTSTAYAMTFDTLSSAGIFEMTLLMKTFGIMVFSCLMDFLPREWHGYSHGFT